MKGSLHHQPHGEAMTSVSERLQQLLDGELDPSEIADDPALVSLADRLYGIKIAPVQPVKRRDLSPSGAGDDGITEIAPPTNMMVEVIAPEAPAIEETVMPLVPIEDMPPAPTVARSTKSPMRLIFASGLLISVANLFGLFGLLLGGMCDPSDLCPSDGYTRINWISVHQLSSGLGWSQSILDGQYGVPDLVAIIGSCIGTVMFTRRK